MSFYSANRSASCLCTRHAIGITFLSMSFDTFVFTPPAERFRRQGLTLARGTFPVWGWDLTIGASHRWNMKDSALTKWQSCLIHMALITDQHPSTTTSCPHSDEICTVHLSDRVRAGVTGRGRGNCKQTGAEEVREDAEQDGSAANGKDWRRPVLQTHASTYHT